RAGGGAPAPRARRDRGEGGQHHAAPVAGGAVQRGPGPRDAERSGEASVIRVNLLPQKRGARSAAPPTNQKWLLVVLGVLVFEVVVLFLFNKKKLDDIQEQQNTNAQLNGKIEGIKKLVANHEEIKKALVQLRAREDAIAKLQSARSGPTAVLLELAQV